LLDFADLLVKLMDHNTQGTESERQKEENMVGSSDGGLRKSTRERTVKQHSDQQYDNRDNTRCRQTTVQIPVQAKSDGNDSGITLRPRPIKDSQGQLQWEVEKILEQNEDGSQMLVKWTGFDECPELGTSDRIASHYGGYVEDQDVHVQ
jgi:hypothetical protein